jgi:hypothetical protein
MILATFDRMGRTKVTWSERKMTTIYTENCTCVLCGGTHEYKVLGSTNTFGSPDLDLRPPEMKRSTMPMWLQRCPDCGYCAGDISVATPNAADILKSDSYQQMLSGDTFPDLAKSFLLFALLNEDSDRWVSGLARLRAAWVCDDAKLDSQAFVCRNLAIDDMAVFVPCEDTEESIGKGCVTIDMLRRTRRFDEATEMIDTLLAYSNTEGILEQVLQYERVLCEKEDAACRTVADAVAQ